MKKKLPGAPEGRAHAGITGQLQPLALQRWNPAAAAVQAKDEEERSISVYDVIGYDWWTGEGVTAKRVAGILRSLGAGPVTVNINSPGGDLFEGMAIYNLLREHKGEITVKVVGLAASAASIIAMAGDTVQIARAGFLMIHNTWVGVPMANRNDLREIADTLEPFDRAMADIYAAHTGGEAKAMGKLMDAETWIGSDAVEQGFADELLPSDQVEQKSGKSAHAHAARRLEAALRSVMPKSEAMKLMSEFKSGAGDPAGNGEGDPTDGRKAAPRVQLEPLPLVQIPSLEGVTR